MGVPRILSLAGRKAQDLWGAPVVEQASVWGTADGGSWPYVIERVPGMEPLYVPAEDSEALNARLEDLWNGMASSHPRNLVDQKQYAARSDEILRQFYEQQAALGRAVKPQKFRTGEPVTVRAYHGSSTPDIYEFKNEFLGKQTGANSARLGHFFAGSPETSNGYAGRISPDLTPSQEMMHRIHALWAVDQPAFLRIADEAHRLKMEELAIPDPDSVNSTEELRAHLSRLKPGFPLAGLNNDQLRSLLRGERSSAEMANPSDDQFRRAVESSGATLPPMPAPTMYPVMLNFRNPMVRDWDGGDYRDHSYSGFLREAKAGGHDGAILLNTYDGGPQDNIFVQFDPSRIRSVNARFDPRNINSRDIMAGATGAAVVGGALAPERAEAAESAQERRRPGLMEGLRATWDDAAGASGELADGVSAVARNIGNPRLWSLVGDSLVDANRRNTLASKSDQALGLAGGFASAGMDLGSMLVDGVLGRHPTINLLRLLHGQSVARPYENPISRRLDRMSRETYDWAAEKAPVNAFIGSMLWPI